MDRLLDLPADSGEVLAEEKEQGPRRAPEGLGGRRAEASDADVGPVLEVFLLHGTSSGASMRLSPRSSK